MKRKRKTSGGAAIIVTVIVVAALVGWGIYYAASKKAASSPSFLYGASVEKPNLVVRGKNLSKVEIWAVPLGANITEKDYELLGVATKDGVASDGSDEWLFPIPTTPLQVAQIFAKAYDKGGVFFATANIAAANPAMLHDLLWGTEK